MVKPGDTPLLDQLVSMVAKLPGLGPRSAKRITLFLLKNRDKVLGSFIETLQEVQQQIKTCESCGNLDTATPCYICTNKQRHTASLCVVEDVDDLWALERIGLYKGRYHVLQGVLSALDGVRPDDLRITDLVKRVQSEPIQEVIMALSATVNGQTTAHYICDRLAFAPHLTITSLARGVPMGGELDYLDEGTLTTAFLARRSMTSS